ncbi:hypothetical protein [Halodesulfovibrio aestuarii]|uniref:hypothetical protein n=1 Tax=Halodesulfovibrio aestuarii TaxID=126333 RepID=UPI003D33FB65
MLRRFDKKEDNSQRMGKFDREASHAWALIMNEIQRLRSKGKTLEEIGKKLHVTRATVSRWISEDIGGERTTFGDMLRHAKALDIDFYDLAGIQPDRIEVADEYDKALGKVLKEFAQDDDLTVEVLESSTKIPTERITAIFDGSIAITAYELYKICKALEIKSNIALNRAAKLIND